MDNMTARVSCFARGFHFRNNDTYIFADDKAELLLGVDYEKIAQSMIQGIPFFMPGVDGSSEEGLRLIVDKQLSPSVLGRSAFCEDMLHKAATNGCSQYVIFAAGYDTFGIRNKNQSLSIYEIDLPELIADKLSRLEKSGLTSNSIFVPCDLSEDTWKSALIEKGFAADRRTFGSLLGISYYLEKAELKKLLMAISEIFPMESEICLDYQSYDKSKETSVNRKLASAASEQMKAKYSSKEMNELLETCGFYVKTELSHDEMTKQYFSAYNNAEPDHKMEAPVGIRYCLASRKNV